MMKLPKDLQKKYGRKRRKKNTASGRKNIMEKEAGNNSIQQLGPFLMQQKEHLMMTKNLLSPKEHKEFLKEIESTRPIIMSDIQEKIGELEGILKKYNPIHLLHYICTKHFFYNPETYIESETESMEIWIEYALSFATAIQPNSSMERPNEEICVRFEALIITIIELCRSYYMTEGAIESTDLTLKSIRFRFIIRYLGCRGDSYENHHLDLVLQSFQPHDAFLQEKFGFSTEEIINFINNLRSEIVDNLAPYKKQKDFALKFQEMAKKHKEKKGDKSEVITEKDIKDFYNNDEMVALREEYLNYLKNLEKFYFKLSPSEELPKALLDLFSIEFGENTPFLEREPFWPLNDSVIYSKPILKYNNDNFGFGSTIFYRNIITILESLIQDTSQTYYINKYLKKKGKVLEELSLKYLKYIMPDAQVYSDVFYFLEINGEQRRYETDGNPGYFEWNIFDLDDGVGGDGDSGFSEIAITVYYESTEGLPNEEYVLSPSEAGSWVLPPYLGSYTITIFARDNDDDRTLIVDSLTTIIIQYQNIIDDDVNPPELSNLLITDDIHEICISFNAVDWSGIEYIQILIEGELITPIAQSQVGDLYTYTLANQWILKDDIYGVEIVVTDADNDRPNDALTSSILGSFEISLNEMYDFVDWQLEVLKEYVDDNLFFIIDWSIRIKLSLAQDLLEDAYYLIEEEYITCGLFHDAMAQVLIEITEFETGFWNLIWLISDEDAEYIISSLHVIRDNIVILMGASVGTEQGYDIALIEVNLLDLNDFIEEEISAGERACLEGLISTTAAELEVAIFEISLGMNLECILTSAQCTLDLAKTEVDCLLNSGKISEDLANILILNINQAQNDIENIKSTL